MTLSETIISAILLILSGAVGKLWHDNRKLSNEVAKLSRILGLYAGLKASVKSCSVQGCMLKGIVGVAFGHGALDDGVDAS